MRAGRAIPLSCRLMHVWLGLGATLFALGGMASETPPGSSGYVSRTWNTDHGLPHNVITKIQQDRTGYLWIATLSGLTRFDGREFKVYPVPTPVPTGKRNVRDLAVLQDGTVVFVPASGGIWQVKDNVLSTHPASPHLEAEALLQVHAEPGGALWFETWTDLARWEGGRLQRFGRTEGISRRTLHFSWAADEHGRTWIGGPSFLGYYHHGKLVSVRETGNVVFRVAPSRSGGIWVFADRLYKWENKTLVPIADSPWPPGRASARCLYEDRAGTLWLASSREGLFQFDGKQFRLVPDGGSAVEYVTEDHERNLWLATDSAGIRRLRTRAFTALEGQITTAAADDAGTLWFAGNYSGIIRRHAGQQDAFPQRAGRGVLLVTSVHPDAHGTLWVGTPNGLFQASVDDPATLRRVDIGTRSVRGFFLARNGDMWTMGARVLGFFRDGVYTSHIDAIPAGQDVTAMAESADGHLWFGSVRGSLFELSRGGAITRSPLQLGIGEGTIHVIVADPGGGLWLGTTEGLVRIANGTARRFTQADGLPDDIVLQLLQDAEGDLWLATPRGIFQVFRDELLEVAAGRSARLNARAYGPEQGLYGIAPSTNYQPAAVRDAQGDLWFCTYRGALAIHPSRFQRNTTPPPVLVDEVVIDDNSIPARGLVKVPPGKHRLAFRLAALSFAAPEQAHMRHQLKGYDADWVDTAADRTARYVNVPPGNYTLHVIASNSEGVWNREGISIGVAVLPAWWQTSWARGGLVLGCAGLAGLGAWFWSRRRLQAQLERLERENALEKERARIARDMHDELGGTVTGINLVVQRIRDEKDGAVDSLVDLLDRRVRRLTIELERVVWTVSPKNTSLDQLATFIERFAHNLFVDSPVLCRVHGREAIPPLPLNPECQHHVLAVTKEAINNILKHSHATEATIDLSFEDGRFGLRISDNGQGFSPEAQAHSERNGLRNMRSRIAELSGFLTIDSVPGKGTTVELRVPLTAPRPTTPCPSPSPS